MREDSAGNGATKSVEWLRLAFDTAGLKEQQIPQPPFFFKGEMKPAPRSHFKGGYRFGRC
jgi:hypothetical protein